jgi:hypothetical protein
LEANIQAIQQQMQESVKEMANLKERLTGQGINLDQMKLAHIPWTDLIKVKLGVVLWRKQMDVFQGQKTRKS